MTADRQKGRHSTNDKEIKIQIVRLTEGYKEKEEYKSKGRFKGEREG